MKKLKLLWVFLYFVVFTIIFTYPLAFHLKDSTIGGYGDNIYFVWLIRWYQGVIFEGKGQLFFNPWMNFPEGWNLSTTDTTLASALPGVPFSLLFGPITGYNIAMLLTFVLSGFFMYLWARGLTKSDGAALVAGTMFAFLPYRMAHFIIGHLNLSGTQWFPLFFFGLYRLLRSGKKFDLKFILLTALSLGAIGFTSMYYLYMTLLISGIFIAFYLIFTRFHPLRSKNFWLNTAITLVLALPLAYLSIKPFIELSRTGEIASRSIEYVSMYSASPTDFFLPASDHFIFGSILAKFLDRSLWIEGSLYIGLSGMVLTIAALAAAKRLEHKSFIFASGVVVLAAIVLAFGIDLHWNNQHILWSVPPFLQPLIKRSETYIYMPSYWLFFKLPFFSNMRALMRFGIFALVFTCILSALGFHWLWQKTIGWKKTALIILVIAFILFEFYPGSYAGQLSQPVPRKVDLWLADQPDSGAVVQMPFEQSEDQAQLFYTIFHKKPIVGGFFNANQPAQYQAIKPILNRFPHPEAIQALSELGVEYIVVDCNAYEDFGEVQKSIENSGLHLLTIQENQYVYGFTNEN